MSTRPSFFITLHFYFCLLFPAPPSARPSGRDSRSTSVSILTPQRARLVPTDRAVNHDETTPETRGVKVRFHESVSVIEPV
jgi:hypothetical protein